MTFASWWAYKYRECGEVPEQFFNMMRDAYECGNERGKNDEREACEKLCKDQGGPWGEVFAGAIRMRSTDDQN